MKIIVLVGLPLSGKSSHAKLFAERDGIPLVETGPFVYKAVEERGLEATPENVRKVAGECKSINDAYFTIKALEFIEENYSLKPVVFLSGIKARSEIEVCEEKFGQGNIFTVTFHASESTRHTRLTNKDRMEASQAQGESKATEDKAMAADIERFRTRDAKELSYGLGNLIALADYVVNTEDKRWPYHSKEETEKQFDEIIKEIVNS